MTPAEKVARLYSQRHSLRPPVDVRKLVLSIADLEEDDIPGNADAIFLGASGSRKRPLVIIKRNRPQTRLTFTLGHELGHAVIPWHTGTYFCHVDFNAKLADHAYREVETEANRFSSELLTPSSWVSRIAAQPGTIASKLEILKTSGLSALACSFSLIRQLPPGHVFAEADEFDEVRYSAASPNSPIAALVVGGTVGTQIDQLGATRETISIPFGTLYWWTLPASTAVRPALPDRSSKSLLNDILSQSGFSGTEADSLRQTINGIISVGNQKYERAPNCDFFSLLKGRFLNRSHLTDVIEHPLFDDFLRARASELLNRK